MTTYTGTTRRKVQIQKSFERRAFLYMRLSGALLLFLAVGHMVLQHLLNDVHDLSLQFVADQWSSWGWKVYDMLLLLFALSHGINGFRNVLEDYIHKAATVKIVNAVLLVFLIVTLVVAGYAIASF